MQHYSVYSTVGPTGDIGTAGPGGTAGSTGSTGPTGNDGPIGPTGLGVTAIEGTGDATSDGGQTLSITVQTETIYGLSDINYEFHVGRTPAAGSSGSVYNENLGTGVPFVKGSSFDSITFRSLTFSNDYTVTATGKDLLVSSDLSGGTSSVIAGRAGSLLFLLGGSTGDGGTGTTFARGATFTYFDTGTSYDGESISATFKNVTNIIRGRTFGSGTFPQFKVSESNIAYIDSKELLNRQITSLITGIPGKGNTFASYDYGNAFYMTFIVDTTRETTIGEDVFGNPVGITFDVPSSFTGGWTSGTEFERQTIHTVNCMSVDAGTSWFCFEPNKSFDETYFDDYGLGSCCYSVYEPGDPSGFTSGNQPGEIEGRWVPYCRDYTTKTGCDSLSGTFSGSKTCSETLCGRDKSDLIGACCTNDICVETTNDGNCERYGGTFYVGYDCDKIPCVPLCSTLEAVGACCTEIGTCVDNVYEDFCDSIGGYYSGNGTACENIDCCEYTANGACCIGSACFTITAPNCQTMGGIFYGIGTQCSGSPFDNDVKCCEESPNEPLGACCCSAEGEPVVCADNVLQSVCWEQGGVCEFYPNTTCEESGCDGPIPPGGLPQCDCTGTEDEEDNPPRWGIVAIDATPQNRGPYLPSTDHAYNSSYSGFSTRNNGFANTYLQHQCSGDDSYLCPGELYNGSVCDLQTMCTTCNAGVLEPEPWYCNSLDGNGVNHETMFWLAAMQWEETGMAWYVPSKDELAFLVGQRKIWGRGFTNLFDFDEADESNVVALSSSRWTNTSGENELYWFAQTLAGNNWGEVISVSSDNYDPFNEPHSNIRNILFRRILVGLPEWEDKWNVGAHANTLPGGAFPDGSTEGTWLGVYEPNCSVGWGRNIYWPNQDGENIDGDPYYYCVDPLEKGRCCYPCGNDDPCCEHSTEYACWHGTGNHIWSNPGMVCNQNDGIEVCSSWPPNTNGACCDEDMQTCWDTTSYNCSDTFYPLESCVDSPCPFDQTDTWACCHCKGTTPDCTEVPTQQDCDIIGGIFHENTLCADYDCSSNHNCDINPPVIGRCCYLDVDDNCSRCVNVPYDVCTNAFNGSWNDTTTCEETACSILEPNCISCPTCGPCCLCTYHAEIDQYISTCYNNVPEDTCMLIGGTPHAEETCNNVNCTDPCTVPPEYTGTCCYELEEIPHCNEDVTASWCNSQNGTWSVDVQSCVDRNCEYTGSYSCCTVNANGDNVCVDDVPPSLCWPGVPSPDPCSVRQASGGDCQPTMNPYGSCCTSQDTAYGVYHTCTPIVTEPECEDAFGVWSIDDCAIRTDCNNEIILSCCLNDECIDIDPWTCVSLGGSPDETLTCQERIDNGEVGCGAVLPTVGSCCFDIENNYCNPEGPYCIDGVTDLHCESMGFPVPGAFDPEYTCAERALFNPNICGLDLPTYSCGACCRCSEGVFRCDNIPEFVCDIMDGIFHGDEIYCNSTCSVGEVCDSNTTYGRCCIDYECTFTTEFDCLEDGGEWTASAPCMYGEDCGDPDDEKTCVYCTYENSRHGQLPSTAYANSSDHCKLIAQFNGGSVYSFHYDANGIDEESEIRTTPCVGYCFAQIPGTDEKILPSENPTLPPLTAPFTLDWFDIVKRSGTQHVNSYGFLYRKGENWSSDKTDWSFDYIGVPVLGLESKLDTTAMTALGAVLSSKITRPPPNGRPAPDNLAGDGTPESRHILDGSGVDKPDWIGDTYKLNESSTCPCHDDFWRCDIPRVFWDPSDDTPYEENDECCQQKLYEWTAKNPGPYHNDFGDYDNCPHGGGIFGPDCPDAGYYLSGLTGYAWGEWDMDGNPSRCIFNAEFDDIDVPAYHGQILGCIGIPNQDNDVFFMVDDADMVMEMPPDGPNGPGFAGWTGDDGEPNYAWPANKCVVGCEPQRYDSSCVVSKNSHYPIPFVVYSTNSDYDPYINEKTQVYRWDGPDANALNNRYYTVCNPTQLCNWGGACPAPTVNCSGNNFVDGMEGCNDLGSGPWTGLDCGEGFFGFVYETYSVQDRIVLLKMTLEQVEEMFGGNIDWAVMSDELRLNYRGGDPSGYRCDGEHEDCDTIMYGYEDTDSNEGDMINSTEILVDGLNALLMTNQTLTVEDNVYYDSGCCGTARPSSDPFHDPNAEYTPYGPHGFQDCFEIEYYDNPNLPNGDPWPMFTVAIGIPDCAGGHGTAFVISIHGGVLPPTDIPCVECDVLDWVPTIAPIHCCMEVECDSVGCSVGSEQPDTGASIWIPPTGIQPQQQPGSHHRTPSEINNNRDKYVGGGDK